MQRKPRTSKAMIYYAMSNLDIAVSANKKKVRKFAKNLRFAGLDLQFGCCNRQTFGSPEKFKAEFGNCNIYDVDQKLVFQPGFSVVRSF